jgi:hypothetical protein
VLRRGETDDVAGEHLWAGGARLGQVPAARARAGSGSAADDVAARHAVVDPAVVTR